MVQYPNEVTIRVGKYSRNPAHELDARLAPMTLAQASYLMTLCEESDEVLDDSLTQAEAATLIARLEDVTGRGPGHGPKLA